MLKMFGIFLLLFSLCLCGLAGAAEAESPLAINVDPDVITIGAAYNGTEIVVSGSVDPDADVVVRMVGKQKNEQFKVKGKAFGLLWMNMETVELDHVPDLLLVLPSPDLEDLMAHHPEAWQRLGLGFETLRDTIEVQPDGQNREMLINELMKLKQRQNLYGIQQDAVRFTRDGDRKAFSSVIHLPSALKPGDYRIEVYAVHDGRITAKSSRAIEAEEVGMPAFLTSVAFNHSLLYGIVAVLVAVFSGILIGYLFKGGQEAH